MKLPQETSIYIDFDGTICPNKDNLNEYPPPGYGCVDTIKMLFERGYRIVIYSVRSNQNATNKVNGHNEMLEYLEKYKIPFTSIDFSKPHFDILIDDKSVGTQLKNRNVDWLEVSMQLYYKGIK